MMPYQVYQLYQLERPKSAAEIRRADEQLGQDMARMSRGWRRAAEQIGISRAPYRRERSAQPGPRMHGTAAPARTP